MEKLNLLNTTDSYKLSHWTQYPPKTTYMSSYLESRGGYSDHTLFFGLQYYLKKYLSTPVTKEDVEDMKSFSELHGEPFNYEGWMYIVNELGGKLPVKIRAVPEGSIIPVSNILMSVESTDPKVFWIVSWIETILVNLWYPITVATNSWHVKKIIKGYLDQTSDAPEDEITFKLHDFGARGATCPEAASIAGAAHLVNFMGSDTIAGIWMANKYYHSKMAGYSIPAAEHSTMTMWGRENEVEAYRNMIKQYGNTNIFACVSDSYNIYDAAEKLWGEVLKKDVEDMKAVLVVRPDSGDPVEVVHKLLDILSSKFGYTLNRKGYKVLNKVRIIQGDGIDKSDVGNILGNATINGYSATNIGFGMGGGLIQKNLDRDTHKFAFKCSAAIVDGKEVKVFKEPITDKVKKSKAGILDLVLSNVLGINSVYTINGISDNSLMKLFYENGNMLVDDSFEEIRERTKTVYEKYTGWQDKKI